MEKQHKIKQIKILITIIGKMRNKSTSHEDHLGFLSTLVDSYDNYGYTPNQFLHYNTHI